MFYFEKLEEKLHWRIIIEVGFLAHAAHHPIRFYQLLVVIGSILHIPATMAGPGLSEHFLKVGQ